MAVVVETFDGRLLDGPVHPFNLPIGPRMIWLGQPMLDPIRLTDHVKAHPSSRGCVSVPGLICELDANILCPAVDCAALNDRGSEWCGVNIVRH